MLNKYFVWIFFIILLGSFLRIYSLNGESFWQDEGNTALTIRKYGALQILSNIIKKGQILPEKYYHHNDELPVYYMILHGWGRIFGISEGSLRAFSAILGSLSLVLIFYLMKHLFDEKIAMLATFLNSINITLIVYSQEARQYAYLLLLSLLSISFFLKSLKTNKTKYAIGFIIVNAVIVYSHFPWAMFIAFEGLYAIYVMYLNYTKKRLLHKKVIAVFIIIGLLYLPIIGRVLFSKTDTLHLYGRPGISQLAEFGIQLSSWIYPSEAMRDKIYSYSFNFTVYELALLFSVLVSTLLTGIMFLIGIKKSFYKKSSSVFFLLMFFVPILFALSLSIIHPKITVFEIKQMIYVIPAYLVFVSIGILRIKFAKLLIGTLIILSILPLQAYYSNIDKQQFREAAEFLPKNEVIFINKQSAKPAFEYYYGERSNVIGIDDVEDLKQNLNNMNSFWVLLTFTKYSDPEGKIKKFLDDTYTLVEQKYFFDIETLHYKKR